MHIIEHLVHHDMPCDPNLLFIQSLPFLNCNFTCFSTSTYKIMFDYSTSTCTLQDVFLPDWQSLISRYWFQICLCDVVINNAHMTQ